MFVLLNFKKGWAGLTLDESEPEWLIEKRILISCREAPI